MPLLLDFWLLLMGISRIDFVLSARRSGEELKGLIDSKEKPKKFGLSLLSALAQKDVRTAEAAMDSGADMSLQDDKGDTALILIAGRPGSVYRLLALYRLPTTCLVELVRLAEVKGKWKDSGGLQLRILRKAVKAGAAVDFQNAQGNTALHFASHRGNLELAEALLKSKANPNLSNSEGNTALMYAAHGGHEELCTALLEAGAVDSVNRAGLTAVAMAERKNFKTCAALIHAYILAPKAPRW